MRQIVRGSIVAAALAGAAAGAGAQERLDLVLNFVASGDHSPYYYARKMGWYKQAGIDLAIEVGQGSGLAVQKVGLGKNPVGIADFANALVGRGKGADVVAVMSTYANSPYGMYWLKGSGMKGPKDFAGRKYGVPPGDAGNVMWPAFARAVGIDPASVTIVNVSPLAKIQALKSGAIDFTQSFYSGHAIFSAGLGPDMQHLRWKDVGINPYSNALVVNGAFLRTKPAVAKAFVQVTQRAFAACAANPEPCLQAVVAENSGLKIENERETWRLTMELMDDANAREIALGWFDPKRVAGDYQLVDRYFKFDKAFPPASAFNNELLDKSIRLPKR
jgi:NitT/TauT family transport system substrate-binding protein